MAQQSEPPLSGEALIKETNRRIRCAMAYWKAHNNRACRGERAKALALYHQLSPAQKDKIPQQLRIWLRYRSEKYFGDHRTPPQSSSRTQPPRKSTGPQPKKPRRKKGNPLD